MKVKKEYVCVNCGEMFTSTNKVNHSTCNQCRHKTNWNKLFYIKKNDVKDSINKNLKIVKLTKTGITHIVLKPNTHRLTCKLSDIKDINIYECYIKGCIKDLNNDLKQLQEILSNKNETN